MGTRSSSPSTATRTTRYVGGAVSIIRRSETGWAEPVQITEVSRWAKCGLAPHRGRNRLLRRRELPPAVGRDIEPVHHPPGRNRRSPITEYGPGQDRACQPTWTLDGRIIFNHSTGAEDELGSIAFLNADGSGLETVADDATGGPGNHPRLRPIP